MSKKDPESWSEEIDNDKMHDDDLEARSSAEDLFSQEFIRIIDSQNGIDVSYTAAQALLFAHVLAEAIRHIVGLDSVQADQHFRQFVQDQPSIGATQIRFLDMLKNHIKKYEANEIDRLYEAPFTIIDHDAIDGVFKDDQVDDLPEIINQINKEVA